MSKKNIIGGVVLIAAVLGLFLLSNYLSPGRETIGEWDDIGVSCLPNGHSNLAQHIHQQLRVTVDGSEITIPENIGRLSNCLAEIHTHEGEGGLIHIESTTASKQFKLGDFFGVWGEAFGKDGFERTVIVDTAASTEQGNVILKDGQKIEIIYVDSSKKKNP